MENRMQGTACPKWGRARWNTTDMQRGMRGIFRLAADGPRCEDGVLDGWRRATTAPAQTGADQQAGASSAFSSSAAVMIASRIFRKYSASIRDASQSSSPE